MGIITSSFPFMLGTICGIYIAQNYEVPNIQKLYTNLISKAKQIEETYRKPRRKGDGDC